MRQYNLSDGNLSDSSSCNTAKSMWARSGCKQVENQLALTALVAGSSTAVTQLLDQLQQDVPPLIKAQWPDIPVYGETRTFKSGKLGGQLLDGAMQIVAGVNLYPLIETLVDVQFDHHNDGRVGTVMVSDEIEQKGHVYTYSDKSWSMAGWDEAQVSAMKQDRVNATVARLSKGLMADVAASLKPGLAANLVAELASELACAPSSYVLKKLLDDIKDFIIDNATWEAAGLRKLMVGQAYEQGVVGQQQTLNTAFHPSQRISAICNPSSTDQHLCLEMAVDFYLAHVLANIRRIRSLKVTHQQHKIDRMQQRTLQEDIAWALFKLQVERHILNPDYSAKSDINLSQTRYLQNQTRLKVIVRQERHPGETKLAFMRRAMERFVQRVLNDALDILPHARYEAAQAVGKRLTRLLNQKSDEVNSLVWFWQRYHGQQYGVDARGPTLTMSSQEGVLPEMFVLLTYLLSTNADIQWYREIQLMEQQYRRSLTEVLASCAERLEVC